jgi:NAD(P)-dependent dehydrogenase (short-subunit alcohol dehydrogenase family)
MIGRETMKALRDSGYLVVGVDIAEKSVDDGPYVRADLSDVAALPTLVDTIEAQHGVIRALVNNAGVWSGRGFFEATPADFDLTFAVNARAPFFLTQAVARRIEAAGGSGAIVNVSSLVAKTGSATTDYGMSKAALSNFTRALAKPLGRLGIRINAVAPILIRSAMTDRVSPERRKEMEDASGLGRAGEAREIASVVAFLISDAASYMTGTTVEVDGGA